jgi:single-strand DNA-binding protein
LVVLVLHSVLATPRRVLLGVGQRRCDRSAASGDCSATTTQRPQPTPRRKYRNAAGNIRSATWLRASDSDDSRRKGASNVTRGEMGMSEGLNRVILVGNLCADPELRFTQGAQGVLNMRVACSESYLHNNERKERTEFVNVTVWGKRGEALSKLLEKGSKVWVEGRLQTRSWDDKDGGKRYATDVVANNVGLMGSGKRDASGPRGGREESVPGGASSNDDIPFNRVGDVG